MTALRPQCAACPWRDLNFIANSGIEGVMEAAKEGQSFVCHTRMGPCDGPSHAGVRE